VCWGAAEVPIAPYRLLHRITCYCTELVSRYRAGGRALGNLARERAVSEAFAGLRLSVAESSLEALVEMLRWGGGRGERGGRSAEGGVRALSARN
jgi:hypothetical protein